MKGGIKAVSDRHFLFQKICSLSRKLLKSLKSCDKKIPGPVDKSWLFKDTLTFSLLAKINIYKRERLKTSLPYS